MGSNGNIKINLIRGDINLISKISGYSRRTVYNVLQGKQDNKRITDIVTDMLKERRLRDVYTIKEELQKSYEKRKSNRTKTI